MSKWMTCSNQAIETKRNNKISALEDPDFVPIISTQQGRVLTLVPAVRKLHQLNSHRSSYMALRPLHDRVIVKRLDNERTTASGIVIPDSAAEKPDQGEVVAVGPGKKADDGKAIPVDLKVGDKVLFGKYAGQSVKVD